MPWDLAHKWLGWECWLYLTVGLFGVRGAKGEKVWHWPLFFPRVGFGHLKCASVLEVSGVLPFPPGQIRLCSPGTALYVVISTRCASSSFSLLTLDFNTKMCCKLAFTTQKLPCWVTVFPPSKHHCPAGAKTWVDCQKLWLFMSNLIWNPKTWTGWNKAEEARS